MRSTPPAQSGPTIGAGHLLVLVFGDETDHRLLGPVELGLKKIDAAFKISLARPPLGDLLTQRLVLLSHLRAHPGR